MQAIQTGSNIQLTFTEPTTNADGTPLNDLAKVEITADSGQGPVVVASVPASSPTGGVEQTAQFTVATVDGTTQDVTIVGYAFDIRNNKSLPSAEVVLTIDLLAPAPPQ